MERLLKFIDDYERHGPSILFHSEIASCILERNITKITDIQEAYYYILETIEL